MGIETTSETLESLSQTCIVRSCCRFWQAIAIDSAKFSDSDRHHAARGRLNRYARVVLSGPSAETAHYGPNRRSFPERRRGND
jgi:hypothetical protein